MHAVIYARVSTEEQGNNYSIPAQLAACREYAERNGLQVVAECIDTMSGTRDDRPGLKKVQDLIAARAVQAVIVYHQDRLYRDTAKSMALKQLWRKAGITLHYAQRGAVTGGPEETLLDTIEAAFAEYERLRSRARTDNGRIMKLKSGKPIGQGIVPPYGYRWQGEKRNRELVIYEPEAVHVRRMFQSVLDGEPTRRIASDLDAMGVAPSGNSRHAAARRWYHQTVVGILRNPVYKGLYYSESHQIYVPVPAIVDAELWEAVQARLARNQAMAARNAKRLYPLRGRVRCAECGGPMNGWPARNKVKVYRYYICSARDRESNRTCTNRKNYRAERLEALVWQWVTETVLDETRLAQAIEAARAGEAGQREALERERAVYARQIAEAMEKAARLVDLYAAGGLSLDEFLGYKKHYDQIAQSSQRELDRIDAQLAALDSHHANRDALLAMARTLKAALPIEATPEEQMKVYEALDLRVRIDHDMIYVSVALTGDDATLSIASRQVWSERR